MKDVAQTLNTLFFFYFFALTINDLLINNPNSLHYSAILISSVIDSILTE